MSAQAGSRSIHPVWEVYDLLRTARLNVDYYTVKLAKARSKETNSDILLACVVPGSAIAGLPWWGEGVGTAAWGIIATIAASLALAKPFLKFSDKAQTYSGAVTRYQIVVNELQELRSTIAQERAYDPKHQERLEQIRKNVSAVKGSEPQEPVDETLRLQIYNRIQTEMPASNFIVP